jgi:hypothetical protein
LAEFISEDINHSSNEGKTSYANTYWIWHVKPYLYLFSYYFKAFLFPVDSIRSIRNSTRNIRNFDTFRHSTTGGKQCPVLDNKKRGKKSSITTKRQRIYKHLNKNIFKPLLVYNNLEWSLFDYPVSMLKLNYNLSNLKNNSDYNEAKIHWERDLPKSITNPEQLEEKIKNHNENVNLFFDKEAEQYVRSIQWNDFLLSDEQSGIPPLNHICIPNTIRQIRRDWLEGANSKRFERYDRDSRVYSLNGIAIAHIEPHLENYLSESLDVLRNHYTINQRLRYFREQREQLLREHGALQKEIGKEIVSKIERQQYTTTCQHCDDTAISPKP